MQKWLKFVSVENALAEEVAEEWAHACGVRSLGSMLLLELRDSSKYMMIMQKVRTYIGTA